MFQNLFFTSLNVFLLFLIEMPFSFFSWSIICLSVFLSVGLSIYLLVCLILLSICLY